MPFAQNLTIEQRGRKREKEGWFYKFCAASRATNGHHRPVLAIDPEGAQHARKDHMDHLDDASTHGFWRSQPIDGYRPALTAVAIVLLAHADPRSYIAVPGMETLCREAGGVTDPARGGGAGAAWLRRAPPHPTGALSPLR